MSVHYKAPSGSVLWVAGRKKGGGRLCTGNRCVVGPFPGPVQRSTLKEKRGVKDA